MEIKRILQILLGIVILLLCLWLAQPWLAYNADCAPKIQWIKQKYNDYNALWFNGQLPNVQIVWIFDSNYKARTEHFPPDRFKMSFNPVYNTSETDTEFHLLHEMCHLKTWKQIGLFDDAHSAPWQVCMKDLAARGAFENVW